MEGSRERIAKSACAMKTFLTVSCGLALSLALAGASVAETATAAPVHLTPLNNSGETAIATFQQEADGVKVSVRTKNGGSDPQPVHIHTGSCENQPAVKYPLTTIVDGSSVTMLKGVKLAELSDADYVINIHKSTKEMGTYVSCGSLKGMVRS